MVGKEISLSGSRVENNSKGGNPQALKMQNPEPVEVFNSRLLKGEKPFLKTPLMRKIEDQHDGTPIDRILRSFYWDKKKSSRRIGIELDKSGDTISEATIYSWLVRLGVGTRSPHDAVLAWRAGRQPSEVFIKRISPTKNKLTEVRETFEIESEEKTGVFLGAMYKQYQSLEAVAKALRESGIKVGSTIVKNWMSHFGLDIDVLLKEDDKNLVQNAVQNGDLDVLTEKQKNILKSRGYFKEGRLTPFRKLEEVQSKTITYQTAFDSEIRTLGRLKKRVHARLKMAEPVVRRPVGRPKQNKPEMESGKDGFKIPRNPRGRPKRQMPSDLIVDLYSNGLGATVIAGMFGCSATTIIGRLRMRGIEIKPRGRYYKQK